MRYTNEQQAVIDAINDADDGRIIAVNSIAGIPCSKEQRHVCRCTGQAENTISSLCHTEATNSLQQMVMKVNTKCEKF